MVPLVVGCPVAHRAWILHAWFDAVEESCERAGLKPTFVFVVDRDDDCIGIIEERARTGAMELVERAKGTDLRTWNPRRFQYMVKLRNRLLGLVRGISPQRFLSIDSDILAHPELVGRLVEDLDSSLHDAVGGKCYMEQTGTRTPSWGRFGPSGSLQRYDANGYFPADVIMAIKMMSRRAYEVDYEFDLQGEDIGWSRACRREGVRLAWDGRIASKHILAAHMLGRVDDRVGF